MRMIISSYFEVKLQLYSLIEDEDFYLDTASSIAHVASVIVEQELANEKNSGWKKRLSFPAKRACSSSGHFLKTGPTLHRKVFGSNFELAVSLIFMVSSFLEIVNAQHSGRPLIKRLSVLDFYIGQK